MTLAEIPLASGLRYIADDCIAAVRIGVRRFWRGGEYVNAPANVAISLLNTMLRVLRFTFVLLALHLDVAPLKPRGRAPRAPRRAALRKPGFRLFGRYRVTFDDAPQRPQPRPLARAGALPRDRFLTVRRKLDVLARALDNPMPLIARMARLLPTRLMVFGWRPPKRPPPRRRRDFHHELLAIHREARFHLSEWRRRRRDSARLASGS